MRIIELGIDRFQPMKIQDGTDTSNSACGHQMRLSVTKRWIRFLVRVVQAGKHLHTGFRRVNSRVTPFKAVVFIDTTFWKRSRLFPWSSLLFEQVQWTVEVVNFRRASTSIKEIHTYEVIFRITVWAWWKGWDERLFFNTIRGMVETNKYFYRDWRDSHFQNEILGTTGISTETPQVISTTAFLAYILALFSSSYCFQASGLELCPRANRED